MKSFRNRILVLFSAICAVSPLLAEDRMPPIPVERMNEAQKKAVADVTAPRGGGLPGWLVALSRSPQVMVRTKSLGDYLVREKKTLSPRLTELAIILVARQWTQQYLWTSHRPAAIRAGLKEEIVNAISEGRTPPGMSEEEQALYDFCTALLNNHEVDDPAYARAVAKFGEEGVVDAQGLMGYYVLLAMVMNTGHTPLPPGVKQPLLQPLHR